MRTRDDWDGILETATTATMIAAVALPALFFGGMRNPEFAAFPVIALWVWIARLWILRSPRVLLHPALWPLVAFAGYAAWRAADTAAPYFARMELMALTATALMFALALQNLHRQETSALTTHALTAIACVIAAYAVLQMVRNSDTVLWLRQPGAYSKRAGGTFINPNDLAGFLSLFVPMALAMVFLGRTAAVIKVLYSYAALVMLAGVAVTMSRGGWIANGAGVASFLVWLAWRRPRLRLPLGVIGVALAAGAFVFLDTIEKARARVDHAFDGGTIDSGLSRSWLWKATGEMWLDHPWTGVGPAQFDVEFGPYRPPGVQVHPGWSHNDYLNLLADYGVVGGALALATLGTVAWVAARTVKYVERGPNDLAAKNSTRAALFFGAAAGLAALAVHLGLDFVFHIPAIAMAAALFAGIAASQVRFATERLWWSPGWIGRLGLTAAATALTVWMAPRLFQAGRESYWLNRAAHSTRIDDGLIATLESAATAAPDNPRTAFEIGENLRRRSAKGRGDWIAEAERAERWLARSTQLNPRDADARLSLARVRYRLGKTQEAEVDFALARQLEPRSFTVANQVAWHFLELGRTNEAKALFDQSLQWRPWGNPMAQELSARLTAPQPK